MIKIVRKQKHADKALRSIKDAGGILTRADEEVIKFDDPIDAIFTLMRARKLIKAAEKNLQNYFLDRTPIRTCD